MISVRWLCGGLVAAGLWLAPGVALAGPGYLVRVQPEPDLSAAAFAGCRRAVFEAEQKRAEGASGRLLGCIRSEREAGSALVNAAVPRSVEHLMEAAVADTANAIARLVVP